MARQKELEARIKVSGTLEPSVRRAFRSAAAAAKSFDASVMKVAGTAAAVGAAVVTACAGIAAKLGTDCVRAASAFEKQMSNVATLLDGDWKGRISELSDELIAVKRVTKKPMDDLVNGAYNIISAFGDAPDTAQKVEIAAKAAAAGLAETSDAVNLFSAEMKAYGDTSAEFEQKLADQAFMVVKLGQTDFPSLAAAMPSVVPLAKMMGMKIEEVNGYLATLTGVTGGASEVTTQLSAALTALLKPSKEMQKSIEALGFKDGQAMVKAQGLQASLIALRKTVNTDVEYGNLFGRKEGINFALAATGELADAVTEKTKAMFGAVGIADEAFKRSGDNLEGRINAIRNEFDTAQLQIGLMFTPALKALAEKVLPHVQSMLQQLTNSLKSWLAAMQNWARSVDWAAAWQRVSGYVAAAANAFRAAAAFVQRNIKHIKTLGKVILTLVVSLRAVQTGIAIFSALSAAVALVTSPVFLTVAAIVALVAAAWFLYDNWEEVCAWCGKAWDSFTATMTDLWHTFADTFPATARLLETLWNATAQAMGEVWNALTKEFTTEMGAAASGLKGLWEDVKIAAEYIGPFIVMSWKVTFEAIRAAVQVLSIYFIGLMKSWNEVFAGVTALLSGDWDGFCAHFKAAAGIMKDTFISVWQQIESFVQSVFEHILAFIQPIVDKIQGMGEFLQDAKGMASGAWDSAKKMVGFAHGGFTNGVSICGEAGTEAVLSFNPADRKANQGYWLQAGEMLGMLSAGNSTTNITNFGGITFSPIIKSGEMSDRGDIIHQLRAAIPELLDMIETGLNERSGHRYGRA